MTNVLNKTIAVIVLVTMLSVNAFADTGQKRSGIGIRSSFFKGPNFSSKVHVNTHNGSTEVKSGGFGGSLFLFSRLNDNMFAEFTLGAIGTVEEASNYYRQDVEVAAVTPILLTLRYNLLPIENTMAIQPYVSGGIGSYLVSDVNVKDRHVDEEVKVETNLNGGLHLGAGFNFNISEWFGINVDTKYHLVNMNSSHRFSGLEFGLGCSFMWGDYIKK